MCNGLRYVVQTGAHWRWLPHDLPPWPVVDQQGQRWLKAGCCERLVHALRALVRVAAGRAAQPSAAIFDRQTRQSTPESGGPAGDDGAKRKQGSNVHAAVDTLGQLLARQVTPATEQDRAPVERLAAAVPAATGESGELAYVDQGDTGEAPAKAAAAHGIRLAVVKHPEGSRGFSLLPRRWVVERSFAWKTRCRRLVRDDERLTSTVEGWPWVAFARLTLAKAAPLLPEVHNSL